jgi:hypothetical protein
MQGWILDSSRWEPMLGERIAWGGVSAAGEKKKTVGARGGYLNG